MKSDSFKTRAPLAYLVHEVAKLMKRRFDEEAQRHGITMPQWRTLAVIAQHDGITQSAIAAEIDADPMTVSGILDRLDKRRLIDRYPDPSDSRAKLATLTDEGQLLYEEARRVGLDLYRSTLVGLSQSEQDAALHALCLMRDNLLGQPAREKETA